MGKIRVFVAIELVDTVKSEIGKFQGELKKVKAGVKWARPENIHLTLKFLGNIDADQISEIEEEIKKITESVCPFTIMIEKIGSFPVSGNPRVIWVGINDPGLF